VTRQLCCGFQDKHQAATVHDMTDGRNLRLNDIGDGLGIILWYKRKVLFTKCRWPAEIHQYEKALVRELTKEELPCVKKLNIGLYATVRILRILFSIK